MEQKNPDLAKLLVDYASQNNQQKLADLLAQGASLKEELIDKSGPCFALHAALAHGHLDLAAWLYQMGEPQHANNRTDCQGRDALYWAIYSNNKTVFLGYALFSKADLLSVTPEQINYLLQENPNNVIAKIYRHWHDYLDENTEEEEPYVLLDILTRCNKKPSLTLINNPLLHSQNPAASQFIALLSEVFKSRLT